MKRKAQKFSIETSLAHNRTIIIFRYDRKKIPFNVGTCFSHWPFSVWVTHNFSSSQKKIHLSKLLSLATLPINFPLTTPSLIFF